MTCRKCGRPSNQRLCRECHLEDTWGTPEEQAENGYDLYWPSEFIKSHRSALECTICNDRFASWKDANAHVEEEHADRLSKYQWST